MHRNYSVFGSIVEQGMLDVLSLAINEMQGVCSKVSEKNFSGDLFDVLVGECLLRVHEMLFYASAIYERFLAICFISGALKTSFCACTL